MWAAGVAAGLAVVAQWGIVGRGYVWLAGGVTALLAVPAAVAGAAPWAWIGAAVVGAAVVSPRSATTSLSALAAVLLAAGAAGSGWNAAGAVTGAVFLGGVTTEMMLGHWYLVDPTMPRWALRRLVGVGAAGAVLDGTVVALSGAVPWVAGDGPVVGGFALLWIATVVLLLGVFGALRERGYSGVMAATGLSYLALLTAIGAAVVGRMLASGPVLA